jgi:predicted nucleic acid-binding protein
MVMILLDTTVLIDYTRGKDAKLLSLINTLTLGICGVVRAESLAGCRSAADRKKLTSILNGFVQIPTPETYWDAVGDNLAELRRNGVTVPFPDAVIATLGILLDVEVWSRDPHFPTMQRFLPALKLFHEPP